MANSAKKSSRDPVLPPPSAGNGSRHILRSPHGVALTFTWLPGVRGWSREGGNASHWTAEHLSASGWRYVGVKGTF